MNQTKYLLALHRGLNLTLPRFQKLKKTFDNDWEACTKSSPKDWQMAGMDQKSIEKWFHYYKKCDPNQEEDLLKKCGANLYIYEADNYPIALQHTPGSPVLLFVRGTIEDQDWPSLAVVGSRKVSQYGKRALEKLITPIATSNVTIVSGLAYGIDTLAHEIALKNGSRTLAVLGNGIDTIYPQQNHHLAEKIIQNGAIISEFLPGVSARPENFPRRNRIIAGLTQATLVVEAAQKSGSLITAQYAADFGRDVFAVPGQIFDPQAQGTNQLISDGAGLALSADIILKSMGINNKNKPLKINLPTQGIEAEILRIFPINKVLHIDDITRLSGFPGTTISANLMLMEIKGWIKNMGRQTYTRNV